LTVERKRGDKTLITSVSLNGTLIVRVLSGVVYIIKSKGLSTEPRKRNIQTVTLDV